jgi:hypothetical protein
MADAFISYCRQDRRMAIGWKQSLEHAGLSVWRDGDIAAGELWTTELLSALRESKVVIVLWSENSWKSQWVRQEAFYGLVQNKLVAVDMEDHPAPLDELPFSAIQAISNKRSNIPKILARVREIVG